MPPTAPGQERDRAPQAIYLITGISAAGKSTVAQLLTEQLPRAVHVRGDVFRRMVVTGRAEMTPDPTAEAERQLNLRHRLTAKVADEYFAAGFSVVAQDIILGEHLPRMTRLIRGRPLHVIVLAPGPTTIAVREARRTKSGYGGGWSVTALDQALRKDTPRIGLWLDNSEQHPQETVAEILQLSRPLGEGDDGV
ncbi:AAA family ATPase [Streptomyces sp. A7024]|uniref:AAA family ATPase n=1 Tax=Streptomyces coryli TaxID=1128680 RepID=A0A6G4U9V3_9ACTN|nr:AAA family ATPase [Streptomyces coryli]NGN69009.1 AAA family ATPase [Streptomyces coryli]